MKQTIWAIPWAFLLIFALPVHGKILRVPSEYATIQAAITAAVADDTILLADGIYSGQGNVNISINKPVTIRSENGRDFCIIDGNGVPSGETPPRGRPPYNISQPSFAFNRFTNNTIEGITFRDFSGLPNGPIYADGSETVNIVNCCFKNNNALNSGGAIKVISNTSLNVYNCIFENNTANSDGGAIHIMPGTLLKQSVSHCTFISNKAGRGGAIGIENSSLIVEDCIFINNSAGRLVNTANADGGAILIRYPRTILIRNCEFIGNCADSKSMARGGAIYAEMTLHESIFALSDSVIKNNRSWSNNTAYGGGIFLNLMSSFQSILCSINSCQIEQNKCVIETTSANQCAGGGIYVNTGKFTAENNIIRGNEAAYGEAIFTNESTLMLFNCLISGNVFNSKKWNQELCSAVMLQGSKKTTIAGSTLTGNMGYQAIANSNKLSLVNSIIHTGWKGRYSRNAIHPSSAIEATYCNIQMSSGGKLPYPGQGNINADPCFIAAGYWDANGTSDRTDDFWVEGNYHLRPKSECIDAGAFAGMLSNKDLEGNPRISGLRPDMGSYEFRKINCPPIANAGLDQTAYAWINGIAKVTLDGSDSNNPDGDTLNYKWRWAIDPNTIYEANGVNPVIELPAGEHIITLIVNDGAVDSEPNQATINVIAPICCPEAWFVPRILVCNDSNGYICVMIKLPADVSLKDIDSTVPWTFEPGGAKAKMELNSANRKGKFKLLYFKKADILPLPANGLQTASVVGKMKDGRYIYCSGQIRVFVPKIHGRI